MTNTGTQPARRSSRRSNEVIAPGFGTRQDLERLARDLSSDSVFPVAAVQAMMESRGRGIRSRRGEAAAATTTTSTPVSSAWADFMKEEGVNDDSKQPGTDSKRSATEEAPAGSNASTGARTYNLTALGKDKKKKKSSGLLVQAGTLEWTVVGRTKNFDWNAAYTLTSPTILSGLRVHSVFTAGHACHSLAIAENGKVYGWGRNESHNLTSGLGKNVWAPTELPGIPAGKVLSASVGKSHTLVLVDKEGVYAVGSNKVGQCGVNKGTEQVANFRKSSFAGGLDPQIVKISCGEDFSVALCSEGHVYSTGSSQYGQLGNGETGEHFITANKIAFSNCFAFTKRTEYHHAPGEKLHVNNAKEKTTPYEDDIRIGDVTCGKHHVLALEAESEGNVSRIFSWGCGNYGVLGHGVQADEYFPRSIGVLQKAMGPTRVVAGPSCSMLMTDQGHVYYWGKHRSVGEATMRPTLVDVLANNQHVVTSAAGGGQTVVCSTSSGQTVAWGQGSYGEMGLEGKKSSSKPAFVPALDGIQVLDLACGVGHTLYVVEDAAKKKMPSVDAEIVTAGLGS